MSIINSYFFFLVFLDVRSLIDSLAQMKVQLSSMKNDGFKTPFRDDGASKQLKSDEVISGNVSEKAAGAMDDLKDDGSTAKHVFNESSTPPEDSKVASKFPIDSESISFIPKSVKLTLFVSRLMDYLFDEHYLKTHTLTGKRGTVGGSLLADAGGKSPMEEYHLKEIIGMCISCGHNIDQLIELLTHHDFVIGAVNERYPGTKADLLAQEKVIHKTIAIKFNNASAAHRANRNSSGTNDPNKRYSSESGSVQSSASYSDENGGVNTSSTGSSV